MQDISIDQSGADEGTARTCTDAACRASARKNNSEEPTVPCASGCTVEGHSLRQVVRRRHKPVPRALPGQHDSCLVRLGQLWEVGRGLEQAVCIHPAHAEGAGACHQPRPCLGQRCWFLHTAA